MYNYVIVREGECMKEAAGEANMTVITIVLIGVVAGVGLLLVPRLMKSSKAKACCTDAGWFVSGSYCCDPASQTSACSNTSKGRYILGSDNFNGKTDANSPFKSCME